VIDGLRFPDDHAFFSETFGTDFVHLHIIASEELRRRRYDAVSEGGRFFRDADLQPVESKIDQLRTLAAAILENNGSISDFEQVLVTVIGKALIGDGCLFQSS
jgi:hypothetical protein